MEAPLGPRGTLELFRVQGRPWSPPHSKGDHGDPSWIHGGAPRPRGTPEPPWNQGRPWSPSWVERGNYRAHLGPRVTLELPRAQGNPWRRETMETLSSQGRPTDPPRLTGDHPRAEAAPRAPVVPRDPLCHPPCQGAQLGTAGAPTLIPLPSPSQLCFSPGLQPGVPGRGASGGSWGDVPNPWGHPGPQRGNDPISVGQNTHSPQR